MLTGVIISSYHIWNNLLSLLPAIYILPAILPKSTFIMIQHIRLSALESSLAASN